MKKNLIRNYRFLSIFIVIFIFWYFFNFIDWKKFIKIFFEVKISIFILGVFFSLLWPVISALRWQKILIRFNFNIKFIKSLKITLFAFSANLFAPAKSGDLVKIFAHTNIRNKSFLFSGIISDRISDLIVLSILTFIGGIYLKNNMGIILGISIFVVILSLILLNLSFKHKFKNKFIKKLRIIFYNGLNFYSNFSKHILKIIFLSFINWILASVQIWVFFLAFGGDVPLLIVISLFPISVILSLIPLTPSGLGVREVSFVYLFMLYSDPQINLAVSISYFITNSLFPALMGIYFLDEFFEQKKIKNLKIFQNKVNIRKLLKI